jgi:hypothetical protein
MQNTVVGPPCLPQQPHTLGRPATHQQAQKKSSCLMHKCRLANCIRLTASTDEVRLLHTKLDNKPVSDKCFPQLYRCAATHKT